jgi:lambda family phage portal protein
VRAHGREASLVEYPLLNRLVSRLYGSPPSPTVPEAPAPRALPVITPDAMSPYMAPVRNLWHDGEKYPGGFGFTEILTADYWTLRARSAQLFRTNVYARGICRRIVTNAINTGLALESLPDEKILGFDEDALHGWTDDVENRFDLWSYSPALCDYRGQQSFGALQAAAKLAALVSGDVLCVLHQDAVTGLPKVRLVDGARVQSPFGVGPNEPSIPAGHVIRHGVELDAQGRHVAFWIVTADEKLERRVERLPAMGTTGRRVAWLVYGTDKLLDDVRGEPILSLVLQSLREIDRYRDSVQRKAAVNSILAMFVKKDQEVMGSRPLTGGAVVRGVSTVASAQPGGTKRTYNFTEMIPGAVLDELAPGETPQPFSSQGTDQAFGEFERAIISAIAWALELPPEILTLSFSSNYSASQAAIQELRLTLQPWRQDFADAFTQPIYVEWLISEVLAGRIKADGLLESWRDPSLFVEFAAWTGADWTGAIKPSIDPVKTAEGYTKLIEQGLITRDRAAREVTGQKYSKNVAKLKRENELLADANKAIRDAEKPAAPPTAPPLKIVPKPKEENS